MTAGVIAPEPVHALSVLWDDAEGLMDRVVGMLRRRQVAVRSVALGPAAEDGRTRLTVVFDGDGAAADRLARLMRNVVGVHSAHALPVDRVIARELALVTLSPAPDQRVECLDALSLFGAEVLDDDGHRLVAEVTGDAVFVHACLRAVERFGLQDVARTGAAALPRGGHA